MTATINTGIYLVRAPCPRCGIVEDLPCDIQSVLTTPEHDTPSLKVQLKGKPVAHDCRQGRLTDALASSGVDEVTAHVDDGAEHVLYDRDA